MKAHIIKEGNVIDINELRSNERVNEILNQNELLESVFTPIFETIEEEGAEDGGLRVVLSSLALPDKEFAYVSETILRECERSINNAGDKLQLVQYLNAGGYTAEDLTDTFMQLSEQIDESMAPQLSQQKIDFLKRYLGILVMAVNETEGIAKRIIPVPIELCHEDAKIPAYAKLGDAGMDVYAVEDITINPGETVIVPTGLKVALPLGYELEVRPRSGLSAKTPLRVANAPGTIDSGYRDEIGVIVTNIESKIKDLCFHNDGTIDHRSIVYGASYTITKGMRFAQLVLKEVPSCTFYEVDSVKDIGIDREGGFGSSGVSDLIGQDNA